MGSHSCAVSAIGPVPAPLLSATSLCVPFQSLHRILPFFTFSPSLCTCASPYALRWGCVRRCSGHGHSPRRTHVHREPHSSQGRRDGVTTALLFFFSCLSSFSRLQFSLWCEHFFLCLSLFSPVHDSLFFTFMDPSCDLPWWVLGLLLLTRRQRSFELSSPSLQSHRNSRTYASSNGSLDLCNRRAAVLRIQSRISPLSLSLFSLRILTHTHTQN